MEKATPIYVHQSRNGFYVVWDGVTLRQARGLSFRDLEKVILESELPERSKVEILKNIQEITTDFKGSPLAEIKIPTRVYGRDSDYRLGTKALHPRTGKIQVRVRGGWKDLDETLT